MRGRYTVADVMRDYLAWYAAHRKSFRDVELRTNAFILPTLGRNEAADLTTRTIRRWHESLVKSAPLVRTGKGRPQRYRAISDDPDYERRRKASANHVLTILKAALNQAWREGLIASDSAWQRVKPFRDVDLPRVRHLNIDECKRLMNACATDFRGLVRGALLTGCRYGELTAMCCGDFRDDMGTVHVANSKSGKPRSVPLTPEGVRFFGSLVAGRDGDATMFVRDDGKPWGQSHQRRRLADAAKVASINDVSFHILRHTYASALAMNGAPMGVIAAALGHADTRITERHYAEFAPSYVATTIRASVPILTKVSQRACVLRFWGNDEDIGMHLAVSRGAGDAGRVGFWAEHAAEAGLAGTDRVAVG